MNLLLRLLFWNGKRNRERRYGITHFFLAMDIKSYENAINKKLITFEDFGL